MDLFPSWLNQEMWTFQPGPASPSETPVGGRVGRGNHSLPHHLAGCLCLLSQVRVTPRILAQVALPPFCCFHGCQSSPRNLFSLLLEGQPKQPPAFFSNSSAPPHALSPSQPTSQQTGRPAQFEKPVPKENPSKPAHSHVVPSSSGPSAAPACKRALCVHSLHWP